LKVGFWLASAYFGYRSAQVAQPAGYLKQVLLASAYFGYRSAQVAQPAGYFLVDYVKKNYAFNVRLWLASAYFDYRSAQVAQPAGYFSARF